MSNIKKIRNEMSNAEIDALLLISPVNRLYATGFHSSNGAVVITKDWAFFITDSRYIEAAEKTVRDAEVFLSHTEKRIIHWIREIVTNCGIKALGAEEDSLSYSEYLNLEKKLDMKLIPSQSILKRLRASKSRQELENIKAAQAIAERAFEDVLGIIKPGLTEREVAAELTYRMLKYGGEGNSFDPIVVAGRKSSMPHGVPGDEVIQKGDFVTMDFGCVKNGYCTDMTRTVAVGSACDDMRRVYEVVLAAQEAGISAARAGVSGEEIDSAARKVIEEAGYGKYFGHGFGHSLGLEVHESPNAAPGAKREMPEGAVISAEPGIYIPGKFGVRIEDVLYLTERGAENITKTAKELLIL
ncbi:MAG TPA: aminopeptidase P family protein [Clostridiales bacterium]|jgi:Xaa-Pro aminopeptidase|nr:aminopeptidase P family protein [Clostridiales bacterium]